MHFIIYCLFFHVAIAKVPFISHQEHKDYIIKDSYIAIFDDPQSFEITKEKFSKKIEHVWNIDSKFMGFGGNFNKDELEKSIIKFASAVGYISGLLNIIVERYR